jgi:pimeloyl-ACP methyl ester carboxylesterase
MQDATRVLVEAARSFNLEFEDTTSPADGYLESNGIPMHYLDWGQSGKPPLLFLHGGGLTAHTWDFTCLQLRHDYRCLALDLRGHGDSGGEGIVVDPPLLRDDIHGAVAHLGLKEFVLIGMSLGGLTAMAYAAAFSRTLNGVVIVDASPTIREEGGREIGQFTRARPAFASLDEAIEAAHKFNPARPKEHLRYSLLHNLRAGADGKWPWKYDRGDALGPEPEERVTERRQKMEALWAELPKIACPALVVHGGESRVLQREDAERLRDAIPDARLVTVAGAGHTVQGVRPKEFATALRSFLKEIGH